MYVWLVLFVNMYKILFVRLFKIMIAGLICLSFVWISGLILPGTLVVSSFTPILITSRICFTLLVPFMKLHSDQYYTNNIANLRSAITHAI